MKTKKKKTVRIKGNRWFVTFRSAAVGCFLAFLLISIFDKCFGWIIWPLQYEDVIGVSSQIITAVISLVASIAGIAISLQNDECFGVKMTKLYSLRVALHYSIVEVILISISLSLMNLLFYMLGLTLAAIGSLVTATIFLIQVVVLEVPIIARQEKAILKILKDNLIGDYLQNKKTIGVGVEEDADKDLKDAIRFLLHSKTLKEVYKEFKDDNDEDYNQYLLLKLLEFQQYLAFDLKNKYSEHEQYLIAEALTDNVVDVLLRKVEVGDEAYLDISKNKHLLTRVLFRVYEVSRFRNEFLHKIRVLFLCISISSSEKALTNELISDVLLSLASGTVKRGDFGIVGAVRLELSSSSYAITRSSPALDVFAAISLYLYYLCRSEPDFPEKEKKKIESFINEGGVIEEDTVVESWSSLFSEAATEFHVNYERFARLLAKNANNLEYYLNSKEAKFVVLQESFFAQWYVTHLLNAKGFYIFEPDKLMAKVQGFEDYFVFYSKDFFDENGEFSPSDEVKRIAAFYSPDSEGFEYFRISERNNHTVFSWINEIKRKKQEEVSMQAADIDDAAFAQRIRDSLESAIKKEWGYDSTIPVEGAARYYSVLFEKMPDAYNFEESIIDMSIQAVFKDLKDATEKTTVYNDGGFESIITTVLDMKPMYATEGTQQIIPHYILGDDLKKRFIDACNQSVKIKSKIVGGYTLVMDNGFKFNCIVDKVEMRRLTEEEVAKREPEYQRSDGQYVFDGVFLTREDVRKTIQERYVVLTVVINHSVQSSKEKIFSFKPYTKRDN